MPNNTVLGAIIGAVVAFAIILGGFPGLLWLLFLAAVGGVIGAQSDGSVDLSKVFDSFRSGGRG